MDIRPTRRCVAAVLLGIAIAAIAALPPWSPAAEGQHRSITLEGFAGYNTGTWRRDHRKIRYAPFMPVQLDADPGHEFLVKEWRANHWPAKKHWCENTHPAVLHAFDDDGSELWRYAHGPGVEVGYCYAPVLAWDCDGDGIDEVFTRSAEDPAGEWPGMITKNGQAQWLVRLDPATGTERARRPYLRHNGHYDTDGRSGLLPVWCGDGWAIAAVSGYLKGPCRVRLYDPDDLELRWSFTGHDGQGAHVYSAADLDGDGRDEILVGDAAVDDDGSAMWNAKLGHNDSVVAADFLPQHPGLEVFLSGSDRKRRLGVVDGASGTWLWRIDGETGDSQAAVADFRPGRPGLEILTPLFVGKVQGFSRFERVGCYGGDGEVLEAPLGKGDDPDLIKRVAQRSIHWRSDGQASIWGIDLDLGTGASQWWFPMDIEGDWREELVGIDGDRITIIGHAEQLDDGIPALRHDRRYRQTRARGSGGFGMSHYLRPVWGPAWGGARRGGD